MNYFSKLPDFVNRAQGILSMIVGENEHYSLTRSRPHEYQSPTNYSIYKAYNIAKIDI